MSGPLFITFGRPDRRPAPRSGARLRGRWRSCGGGRAVSAGAGACARLCGRLVRAGRGRARRSATATARVEAFRRRWRPTARIATARRCTCAPRRGRSGGERGAQPCRPLFDQYAPRFDRALVGPVVLRRPRCCAAPSRQHGTRFGTMLDLGCGTGLGRRCVPPACGLARGRRPVAEDDRGRAGARASTTGSRSRRSSRSWRPRAKTTASSIWSSRPTCSSMSPTSARWPVRSRAARAGRPVRLHGGDA